MNNNAKLKRSTISIFGSFIILIFMWLMFAGNNNNPDYNNFYNIYYSFINLGIKSYSGVEVGFSTLMRIVGSFNFSYQDFIFVVATIFLINIFIVTRYFSANPMLSFVLYIFFPFMLDIVQIRNSLAYSFVLISLIYLFQKNYWKFFILVIIASFFHITSLFYLAFLLIKYDLKKVTKFSISIILVLFISKTFFMGLLIKFLPFGQKYLIYLDGISYLNLSFYILLILFNILIAYFINMRLVILKQTTVIDNKRIDISNFVLKISVLLILTIPFLSFGSDFFRLYRNMYILFIFNFTNYFTIKVYIKNGISLVVDLLTITVFFLTGYYFLYLYEFEHIFINIFRNNIFLGG